MNRPNGSGTIAKTRSGRWRFRLRGPDGKRRWSPAYETRDEAARVLDAALYELAGCPALPSRAPPEAETLGSYGERWLGRRTVRSVEDERRLWARHVADAPIARLPIGEVRRRHVREWLEALAQTRKLVPKAGRGRGARVQSDQAISPQTVKLSFSLLRRAFSEAICDEVVQVNPCAAFRLPRSAPTDPDLDPAWTFLSEAEIAQVVGCERVPVRRRRVYETAIYTGLRQGELWGLRWRDLQLDGDRPECAVRRSYEGPTKGGKVRRFPLIPPAVAVLRQVRAEAEDTSDDALVFPSPRGGCFADGYDGGWADRHRALAGVRDGVRFHDLRHTCASHLVMGTWGRAWTIAEVRAFLDHSSVQVTERYAHMAPGHLHALASATAGRDTGRGTPGGPVGASGADSPTEIASVLTPVPKQ